MHRLNVLNPRPSGSRLAASPNLDLHERQVVLVGLDWSRDKDPRLPLGQASLTASLITRGALVHNLSYGINQPTFTLTAVIDEVLARAAVSSDSWADVGIGVYVWNDALVQGLCRGLRERGYRGRIILGGPQITYHGPGVAASYPDADAFVRGAGEEALSAIVGEDDRVRPTGVVWRGEADPCEQAVVELDRLPSPYLQGTLDPARHRRFVRWETRRGCLFRCSFCQHRDPGSRPQVQGFALDRTTREIAAFVAAGVESIAVLDPIFNDPRSPYLEILDALIAAGFRGHLSLQCRFELVTPEFLDRCRHLDVTLEFGLQTIHPAEWAVVRRGNHLGKIDAAIAALHQAELDFEVSLIYGLPEQTLASFRETVDWCLHRRIPTVRAFPLMLLRGTELERARGRWGLRESDDVIPRVIAGNTFTEQEHAEMSRIAEALLATEGHHPGSVVELYDGWSGPLDLRRWTPAA